MKAVLLLATLAMGAVTSPALADEPENDAGLRQYCVGDYFRYCAAYLPGSVEIRRCFAAHSADLTPACREAIQKFDARRKRNE